MATEWIDQVQAAFEGLSEPHLAKKKATIIALVDARLAGKPEESVWQMPGVCNRGTYHMKWKKQSAFAAALEEVTRLAVGWKDTRTVRALEQASERMALAAPVAAAKLVGLLGNPDAGIVLRAANSLLDRAGLETAAKGQDSRMSVNVFELSDDELLAIASGSGGDRTIAPEGGAQ